MDHEPPKNNPSPDQIDIENPLPSNENPINENLLPSIENPIVSNEQPIPLLESFIENSISQISTIYTCLACTLSFETFQNGDIICPDGHFFCSTNRCSKTYLETLFAEPHVYYPGKCPMCKKLFAKQDLENLMTETNKVTFFEFEEKFGANAEKEKLNPKNLEAKLEEIKELKVEENKLEEMKKIVHDTIISSSQVFCPSCLTGGRKSLDCNHITCPTCCCMYCYVCAKQESDLNKADEYGDIYSHNEQWTENEERCPMYLREIYQSDNRYPVEDESEALNLFHEMKIKKALKQLFDTLKKEEIEEMEEKYKVIESFGLNLKEILDSEEVIIIKREVC